ncbi:MAG: trypsin-like serine protease, partial [Alphaproteobacteria bacterium]|nr:trypsin-like serine protease [Alphaproteobacteria bacterium]
KLVMVVVMIISSLSFKGGPFICPEEKTGQWLQYGIVSHGLEGCVGGAIYFTRVSRFLDWIRQHAEG